MYKLKEFRDEHLVNAEVSVDKFIKDKNIKEWYVAGYSVERYEQSNQERTYILIRYKEVLNK
ncbi:hypothetical protein [Staphylococcus delphini]|uniref:hypothetical protein n=1 Tax=Staphylococcus delphini TaxID=53344 RepID=UPI000BBC1B9E|nr:hypothetical protein [Staphylococcus delphini]PCF78190.1 hypothetical protein B4W69_13645 [Staphylococcus delphini]